MKQIFFLKIGELTNEHEFIRPVGRLIQIPLKPKTSNGLVYTKVYEQLRPDEEEAYKQYMNAVWDYRPRESFMTSQFFTPEEGIELYAIFEVKEVSG